uniref:Uncharacterized protein n=1 Tax=Nothoprocta perdicaria TaxID=30464 RepID=A0A8C6ZAS0_NOTPE
MEDDQNFSSTRAQGGRRARLERCCWEGTYCNVAPIDCPGAEDRHGGAEPRGRLPEGVEYIPRRKGKNPMRMVGVAWAIGLPSGIALFLLAKQQVDKNRAEQLRIRRKMMGSNQGEYETERYKRAARGA